MDGRTWPILAYWACESPTSALQSFRGEGNTNPAQDAFLTRQSLATRPFPLDYQIRFQLPGFKKDLSGTVAPLPHHMRHKFRSSTLAASTLMHAGTDGRSGIQHAFVLEDEWHHRIQP
ncbi:MULTISPECIES: hypothetical protein [Paraburkholderia]|uniref:Uncharacterized protein n=1 Tax=Paraburkholderia dipogonis TaxID=1211383 RepID=A0ABW9B7F6_9BURK